MALGEQVFPGPRVPPPCRGLGGAGSLHRGEREGGSWRRSGCNRQTQSPGSPVPAARQLGFRKQQERSEPGKGLLLRSGRQPSP